MLKKKAIEREIQLIVECATDINNMVLKYLNRGLAKDYFKSFIELAENDVIAMDFALSIAPSTGLRNVLVQEYRTIDASIVFHSINNTLQQYLQYIRVLSHYLKCD